MGYSVGEFISRVQSGAPVKLTNQLAHDLFFGNPGDGGEGVRLLPNGTTDAGSGAAIDVQDLGAIWTQDQILRCKPMIQAVIRGSVLAEEGTSPILGGPYVSSIYPQWVTFGKVSANTNISFVDGGVDPDTIHLASGSWLTFGFMAGQTITISGSTSNNKSVTIASVDATDITLLATDTLTDEAAGDSVTIVTNSLALPLSGYCRGLRVKSTGSQVYIGTDDDPQNHGWPCSVNEHVWLPLKRVSTLYLYWPSGAAADKVCVCEDGYDGT